MTMFDKSVLQQVKKSDFEEVDDYIIGVECSNCGDVDNYEDGNTTECSDCGSTDIVFYSDHEGERCDTCGASYDTNEVNYQYMGDNVDLIALEVCNKCYESIEQA